MSVFRVWMKLRVSSYNLGSEMETRVYQNSNSRFIMLCLHWKLQKWSYLIILPAKPTPAVCWWSSMSTGRWVKKIDRDCKRRKEIAYGCSLKLVRIAVFYKYSFWGVSTNEVSGQFMNGFYAYDGCRALRTSSRLQNQPRSIHKEERMEIMLRERPMKSLQNSRIHLLIHPFTE